MLPLISFSILGILAIFLSIVMITRKLPVTAAMLLVVIMMLLAGMYGVLGAHFAAASQIIVYAGAIMVVFIFVIMILNVPVSQLHFGRMTIFEMLLVFFGTVSALVLGTKVGQGAFNQVLLKGQWIHTRAPYYPVEENVKNVSLLMFTDYLWAFELISILIIASIIGVIVIAKKDAITRKGEAAHDHSS